MKSLCEAGADANIKNNKNLSSMHMARTQGIKDLIKKIASSYNFIQLLYLFMVTKNYNQQDKKKSKIAMTMTCLQAMTILNKFDLKILV